MVRNREINFSYGSNLSGQRGAQVKVSFDNTEGGRQAAQHLLGLGHRRIAFLALHGAHDEAGEFRWSGEREAGWREALQQAGESTAGLAFHPPRTAQIAFEEQTAAARLAAEALAQRRDISAVVAANQSAMRGLFQALRAAEIPEALWPAVVGFDGISVDVADRSAAAHVVTALRLPWELIGQSAAELLWERQQGRLCGAPQQRWVQMRLIPRLTSHHDWSHAAGTPGLAAIVQSVG